MSKKIAVGRTWVLVGAAVVVVAAGGAVVLGGSGSGGERQGAVGTVSVGPSPSSVTSPPVQAPTVPIGARRSTNDGAEEFFRFFLKLYVHSYNSLDSERFAEVSERDCRFCGSVIQNVTNAKLAGNSVNAPPVNVVTLVAAPGDPAQGIVLNAVISQGSVVTRDADGREVSRSPASVNARVDARVVWVSGEWKMVAVDIVSGGRN